MSAFIDRLSRWWWWLWTGYPSRDAMRRAIETEARRFARRFGGTVSWED